MSAAPPGPVGARRLLMFPLLAADPLRFFTDVSRWYGPICRIPIGPERIVVLAEPDLIREVLVEHAREMHKDHITRTLSRVLGEGLLTSEGAVWRRSRRKVAPSFQRDELAGYAAVMQRRAVAWADSRRDGEAISVTEQMSALTLQIVGETLFGAEEVTQAEAVSAALEALMGVFDRRIRTWRRFLPLELLPGLQQQYTKNHDAIDQVTQRIIQRHQPHPGRRDLLARLKEARDDEGLGFTDQQLRDEVITLFLAGHETTALSLSYTLRLLALHPEAAERLRDELGAHDPDPMSLSGLPWLQAVLRESLRLYPPAWAIGRTNLRDRDLGGYRIREGDAIFMSQWSIHHDPRFYDEPDAFKPERWLDGLERRLPQFAYFPFGGGPRTCVGNHFAMLELGVVLSAIVRRLDFTLLEGEDLPLHPAVTLRPAGPLTARLRRVVSLSRTGHPLGRGRC